MSVKNENPEMKTLEILTEFYEDLFQKAHEKRKGTPRMVGAEIKFPIVKKDGSAIDYENLLELYDFLLKKGFKARKDPYSGDIKEVYREQRISEDVIGTETGFCKLELSIAPESNIFDLEKKYEEIKGYLIEFSKKKEIYFLCYGTQPLSPPGNNLRMGVGRHLYWEKLFGSNRVVSENKGSDVDLFTLNATCQAHVDLKREEIIKAFKTVNGFVPAQIALNGNSKIWKGDIDPRYKAVINMFWEWWLPDSGRVGIPPKPPESLKGYVELMANFSPVFIKRDGEYLSLPFYETFQDYFSEEKAQAEDVDGNIIKVKPEFKDILQHNTFFWHDIRISRYATLENRVNCQQPPGEQMVIPALTLGLVENLDKAKEFVDEFSWEEIQQSRLSAIENGLDGKIKGRPIIDMVQNMVDLAVEGLSNRGMNEEVFLSPLFERIRSRECPADKSVHLFHVGGIPNLVENLSLQ